jgi:signal recognition particle receptor subunit beta
VLQYNKRDLPSAEPVTDLEKKLNFFSVPSFEAVANQGHGVFATLKEIIKQVVHTVQSQLEENQKMRA